MGSYWEQTVCPDCGRTIGHDSLEEASCPCGWNAGIDRRRHLRRWADELGHDYDTLMREFHDDELLESWLWAMDQD
jgi:hypothetical protein